MFLSRTNLYELLFSPNSFSVNADNVVFTLSLDWTRDEVEHSWCSYSHGDFLCVLRSFSSSSDLRDCLQRMTSVVWLAHFNFYSRYRGCLSL